MSQPENNFDDKLNQLYKIHKSDNKLSPQEKKHLITQVKNQNKFNWINTLQISLTAVALFTLFSLYYNQKDYLNSTEEIVYIPSITEIHYLEKNSYHKKIKYAHQQAKEQLAKAQSILNSQKQLRGKLINKADDWYIESCNKDILVQVNASLLQQLQRNNALDNNISQGDLLAFKHNDNGEIIALIKTDNLQQCHG
ncbi:hypothetical protein KO527_09800 [Pseudoalteromonas sp. C2R02]|uniref:hypothetical protein n=1 Tax=Pseudoalteromonas sp. C2R02 TaxID=2841565 RepID=UPI001C07F15A|nr:hypothetical protein [Pseudoalteromonas sp. C2R02]MBU2969638.1 hypothetical protein [Pseudoalteromonas sp. C2R02]